MGKVIHGDCLEQLRLIPDASVDSLVTDPPAGISFMEKSWDSDKGGRDEWIRWLSEVMRECRRVLKPGAHALVWALPRTSGWTHRAIEDAGFEVRDVITALFGSGFPKNQLFKPDKHPEVIAKGFSGWGVGGLKPAAEFWILARKPCSEKTVAANVCKHGTGALNIDGCRVGYKDKSDLDYLKSHNQCSKRTGNPFIEGGTGTNQNDPKWEVNLTGRFPANLVLSHSPECVEVGVKKVKAIQSGTPGARSIGDNGYSFGSANNVLPENGGYGDADGTETVPDFRCVDGCPIKELDGQSGISKSTGGRTVKRGGKYIEGKISAPGEWSSDDPGFGDKGGASRFFYCAKVSPSERNAGMGDKTNGHPTVKATKLMRYLIRLITPPGGLVLDPFAGSGSTGVAAIQEGFQFLGIECEQEYVDIARARIAHTLNT